jgi:O-antigen/teichoic acid export membrane protein
MLKGTGAVRGDEARAQSAVLLTTINLACGAIGAVQGLTVARLLGASAFGVVAIVTALTAVATNVVDVRLQDLVSKLYFDRAATDDVTGAAYKASALRFGLFLYLACAAAIAVLAAALLFVVAPHLSSAVLLSSWCWMAAAAQALSYLGSFCIFVQRFVIAPARMAVVQLTSAVVNAVAMVSAVAMLTGIGGYTAGLAASALAILIVNGCVTVSAFRAAGVSPFGAHARIAIDRRVVWRFVAAGNILGYVKLLHRSADVLLVAYFCADRETGIYKLARSMTDVLYAVSEAIGRVYQPHLLLLLQTGKDGEYRNLARSIGITGTVVTALALVGVVVGVPHVGSVLHWAALPGLTLCTAIMTLPFFFVAALQTWIWPAFISFGRMERCMLWSTIAVLGGQYLVGPVLTLVTGTANPAWFALGYLSYYLLSVLPLWRDLHRMRPSLTGTTGLVAA